VELYAGVGGISWIKGNTAGCTRLYSGVASFTDEFDPTVEQVSVLTPNGVLNGLNLQPGAEA
jgi:hypothetical protein